MGMDGLKGRKADARNVVVPRLTCNRGTPDWKTGLKSGLQRHEVRLRGLHPRHRSGARSLAMASAHVAVELRTRAMNQTMLRHFAGESAKADFVFL
jgi:hypothetical protein